MNRSERNRLRNSAGVTGPREARQLEERAHRLGKSQAPEIIKRYDRKFGKRHQRGRDSRA